MAAKKKKSSRPEIGASGVTNFQGVIDTDEYAVDLQGTTLYTTIDKMRWSDASIQAALLMCELPLRSAEWDIEQGTDDAQGKEIAEYVKDNLFNGLTIPWEDTLRQILLMHPYGCMVFEIIYKITEEGKIGWRKWAPRLPKTIMKWHINKSGELEKIEQRTYKNDTFVTVEIPVEKLMVFVYRKEGDNYRGTSLLRQAYKHWFFRDKYYKIDAVATERLGIGIPVITLPDGFTDDDYKDAEKLGQNLRGHEKAYILKKAEWEVEMLDLKASSTKGVQEMLEHHTREILKSVLAQFIDLGSKSSGSYALAKDQSQIFLSSLDASAKLVEDIINKEIEKLVDYNWTVEEYPKLTHSDLGVKDIKELGEAIQSLTFAGMLTSDPETEDYLRKVLKLPDKPKGSKRVQKDAQKGKKDPDKPDEDDDNGKFKEKKKGFKYHREFTKAELRVRFDEIRDFMDSAEKEVIGKMLAVLNRERTSLLTLFEDAIKRKDFADLQRISWKLKGQYAAVLREQTKRLFEYGKLKSSYEIKKPAPITTAEINRQMVQRAFFLADRHEKQLLKKIKGIAAVAMMDTAITDEQAMLDIAEGFDAFFNRNVPATAALLTSDEVNSGRIYTFEAFKDELYGYQWSAILDGATCNYCQSMDGRVIGTEDKAFKEFKPGAVHFNCRCIWVAITKEEVSPPPFTGIPENLRPQSAVPAWEFKDLEYPLPGAGGRKMPYGVGVH